MSRKALIFWLVFFVLCVVLFFPSPIQQAFLDLKSHFIEEKTSPHTRSSLVVKTPCRWAALGPAFKSEKSLNRLDKLTKLMDSPIDWVFKDIQNQVIDLYCLREKKALVIHFWATWCPPCVEELPSLSELAKEYPNQIFVSAISAEPKQNITRFLNQSFSTLSPHLKIAQVSKGIQLELFPEDKLPVTYIFDRQGLLRSKEMGARDWSNKEFIRTLLQLP